MGLFFVGLSAAAEIADLQNRGWETGDGCLRLARRFVCEQETEVGNVLQLCGNYVGPYYWTLSATF